MQVELDIPTLFQALGELFYANYVKDKQALQRAQANDIALRAEVQADERLAGLRARLDDMEANGVLQRERPTPFSRP